MKSPALLFFLLISYCNVLAQEGSITLNLKNFNIRNDSIFGFDTDAIGFSFNYNFTKDDTIRLKLVHHRGNVPHFWVDFIFVRNRDEINLSFGKYLKAGDEITFIFKRGNEIIKSKTYFVAATPNSMVKPYYYDIYFIYNEDTIATDKYVLGARMKIENHRQFKRIFFDEKEKPTRLMHIYHKESNAFVDFEIDQASLIYHGKITVFYLDKEELKEKHGFTDSIGIDDFR